MCRYSEADYTKSINDNLITFDEVISTCWHHRTTKGKQVVTTKASAFPDRSPLFLNEEMSIINDAISPIWNRFTNLREDWLAEVKKFGFSAIRDEIRTKYNYRWELLAKFSKVTTKRLQIVRTLTKDVKIKKKEVSKAHILDLLNSRGNAKGSSFVSELRDILDSFEKCSDVVPDNLKRQGLGYRQFLTLLSIDYVEKLKVSGAVEIKETAIAPKGEQKYSDKEIDNAMSRITDFVRIHKSYLEQASTLERYAPSDPRTKKKMVQLMNSRETLSLIHI